MVFNSYQYALFLPVVLGLYWLLRRRVPQNALLLVASYGFYAAWDYRFVGLMWISTINDFVVGRLMARTQDERARKRYFLISLLVNLGILGFFKYFDFFVESAADFLRAVGLNPDIPTLNIAVPIGISFYTFHGISYTFDVYRRHIEPSDSILDFACFVAFFPQLVIGPIGRARVQLPQFAKERSFPTPEQWRSAGFLFFLGLFKKVAIADGLAPFVNATFAEASSASALQLIVGAFGFAFQVYGDFSGYADMARGSSRLFGIELLKNFDQPFLSRNFTMFWRTWHISLSTWLRDYLYLPLGGNRGSKLMMYRNLMIVMLVAGLWHGAAWTFVAFGALHGSFLIAHRLWEGRRSRRATAPLRPKVGEPPPRFGQRDIPLAFLTVTGFAFSCIFFRATTFTQAFDYITGIATFRGGPVNIDFVMTLVVAAAVSITIDILQRNSGSETLVLNWRPVARGLVYATFLAAVLIFSGDAPVPFVYFQF